MEFGLIMSMVGIALIGIALGMLIQRTLQESSETEIGRDS